MSHLVRCLFIGSVKMSLKGVVLTSMLGATGILNRVILIVRLLNPGFCVREIRVKDLTQFSFVLC